MDKNVFLYWWFSFDLYLSEFYLILVGTNKVLNSSVKKKFFVHFVGFGTSGKALQ